LGPSAPPAKFSENYRKRINETIYHFDDALRNIQDLHDLYEENMTKAVENSAKSSDGESKPTTRKTPKLKATTSTEEFKAPLGLDTLFSFLKGIKWNIKNVHVRFEEKNISVGFRIEEIDFNTTKSHWSFDWGLSDLNFRRQPNKYINKEFNIVHLAVYTDQDVFVNPKKFEKAFQEPDYFSARKSVQIKSVLDSEMLKSP
jgi:hypothetical protein